MNNFRFFYKNILSVVGCIVVLISININILQAEIINRSRPEPEIRERIHKILRKTMRENYIDVSVILHSVLDNKPVKKDSELIPGVKIKTEDNKVFRKFTLVCAINNEKVIGWTLYENGGINGEE